MAQAALDSEGYNRGMTTHGAMVIIDGDTLDPLCPLHGRLAGAAYTEGRARCGCQWKFDKHGVLRAQRSDSLSFQTETARQEVAECGNE